MSKPFFRITSQFGAQDTPLRSYPHKGVDLATYEGTPLPSASEGEVTAIFDAATSGSIGNGLKVRNPDGVEVIYGHLQEVSVKVGEKVSVGEIIGKTGNTGNSSGPHLHLGAKEHGEFIDPTDFVDIIQSVARKVLDPDWATVFFSTLIKFII